MKLSIYCIYDSAVKAYMTPFFMKTDGQAIRTFQDIINNPQGESNIANHPEQFTLFRVGEYNDETAELQTEVPIALGTGHTLLQEENITKDNIKELFRKLDHLIKMKENNQ